MTQVETRQGFFAKWWRLGIWALLGGIFGYVMADRLPLEVFVPEPSHVIAVLVAALFLLMGQIVLIGTLVPRLGITMRIFDDLDAWEDERALHLYSAFGCNFMGLFLFSLLAPEPFGLVDQTTAAVLAFSLFVLLSWFTWRTWVLMDELWRNVTSEATVVAFYVVFGLGVAWSAAAHFGRVQALEPLDWISLFFAASLIGSVVATGRRGMIRNV